MKERLTLLQRLNKEAEEKKWEDTLFYQIKVVGIPLPERQYKFHPKREFMADFCYQGIHLIIEVDGGIWMEKSGHTSGAGYERDRRRDLEAFLLGYRVVRVTSAMVEDGTAINGIEKLFRGSK